MGLGALSDEEIGGKRGERKGETKKETRKEKRKGMKGERGERKEFRYFRRGGGQLRFELDGEEDRID